MNKQLTLAAILTWMVVVCVYFWKNFTGITEHIRQLDPTLMFFALTTVILGGGYIVYSILSTKEKEKTYTGFPIFLVLGALFFPVAFFFFEYAHVMSYVYGIYAQLGLSEVQMTSQVAKYFHVKDVDLFQSGSVFVQFLGQYSMATLSLVLLFLACLGGGVMWKKAFDELSFGERMFLEVMLGTVVVIAGLFVFGALGLFTSWILFGFLSFLALLALVVEGKSIASFLFTKGSSTRSPLGRVNAFFTTLLLLVVYGVSFLHVLRPIPIGWDDITLYMNLPSLTVQYHGLVSGFNTYNWGLVMASGMAIFGSATYAMLYSFFGSVLMAWGILMLLRRFLGEYDTHGLSGLITTAFVLSPLVQFQTAEDMKVDLALTAMGAAVLMLVSLYHGAREKKGEYLFLVAIGLLLGIMLGVKFTALLFFALVAFLLSWKHGRWGSMVGILGVFSAFLFFSNTIRFGGIEMEAGMRGMIATVCLLLGGGGFVYEYMRQKSTSLHVIGNLLILGTVSFFLFVPWMVFQGLSTCDVVNKCVVPEFSLLLSGKVHAPVLVPKPSGSGALVTDTASVEKFQKEFQKDIPLTAPAGQYFTQFKEFLRTQGRGDIEELQRYRGYNKGILSYLSLPFTTTFGLNERGDFITISWIFLAFFPLLLFAKKMRKKDEGKASMVFDVALLLSLGGVLLVLTFNNWNATSQLSLLGSFATEGWFILLCTMLVYGYLVYLSWKYREEDSWIMILLPATLAYWFGWSYIASGVIWYGILGFLPLLVLLLRSLYLLVEEQIEVLWTMVVLILVLWNIPMFLYKLSSNEVQLPVLNSSVASSIAKACELASANDASLQNLVQKIQQSVSTEAAQEAVANSCIQYREGKITKNDLERTIEEHATKLAYVNYGLPDSLTFILYKAGILTSEQDVLMQMNPPYARAMQIIKESNPEEKIYRIGTFIPYYTPFNDKRLIHDNQLDVFISYYLPEMDKKAFIQVLRDSHVGYIVYDNNTETIDRTVEKTLEKKVKLFKDFLTDNPDLTLMVPEKISNTDAVRVYKIK